MQNSQSKGFLGDHFRFVFIFVFFFVFFLVCLFFVRGYCTIVTYTIANRNESLAWSVPELK